MNNEDQNDERARQQQANTRLAWVLGVISASVFVLMIYYLRAK
jgi:hypothetical protein